MLLVCRVGMWETPSVFHISTRFLFLLLFFLLVSVRFLCITFLRGLKTDGLVPPFLIIKFHIVSYPPEKLPSVCSGTKVNMFIFQTPPEPFNKNIVQCPSFAIHRYLQPVMPPEHIQEHLRGKLAALVGIEYFGHTMLPYRLFKHFCTPYGIHRIGEMSH